MLLSIVGAGQRSTTTLTMNNRRRVYIKRRRKYTTSKNSLPKASRQVNKHERWRRTPVKLSIDLVISKSSGKSIVNRFGDNEH